MTSRQAVAPRSVSLTLAVLVLTLGLLAPAPARAQQVLSTPERVVSAPVGKSALITTPTRMTRLSIAAPDVADAVLVSPTEVLVNGKRIGTTSLFLWDAAGNPHLFTIDVPADVASLQAQMRTLFPGSDIGVTASGGVLVLTGTTTDPIAVRRALELAKATGAQVVNNINAPSAQQVLLHVEFAEVNRSALQRLGVDLSVTNPQHLDQAFNHNAEITASTTISSGLVRLFLLGENAQIEAVVNALKTNGDFKSLAEPNLVTLENQEATFLAGGEFPYPAIQSGAQNGAVTIQFKEFGVRLRFTPQVTNAGAIRLHVAPEVSSLDFANGVSLNGFQVPALLTRRTESDAELQPGQHLAIAGLLDNTLLHNVDKVPLLGDLPILGAFFRSTNARANRTELLVVVTPFIVRPSSTPIPLPTGPAAGWDWERRMKMPADTSRTGTVR